MGIKNGKRDDFNENQGDAMSKIIGNNGGNRAVLDSCLNLEWREGEGSIMRLKEVSVKKRMVGSKKKKKREKKRRVRRVME